MSQGWSLRGDRPGRDRGPSRREWLGLAAAIGASAWLPRGLGADERSSGLIVRNPRPIDAETPTEAFATWKTPNRLFFIRSHFGAPAVDLLGPWEIEIGGMVERPAKLRLEELGRFERAERPAVLQCSGNGRAFFRPRVAGVAWERGAVGNAEWAGVRLRDVLERAGIKDGARHVQFLGADTPPNPKTPLFSRSIPLERALDPTTLLATRMNGEALPVLHGGPVRLVVPGWSGNHWMKWVRWIGVEKDEAPGFFMQAGYRLPKRPYPPGAEIPAAELEPLTTLNVKSLFARPSPGATLRAGRIEVRGVAWTGVGHITRVEVSIDGVPWRPADLNGPDVEGSWRTWHFAWDARPGPHELRARATDSRGQAQPEAPPWNKSGYLWNGIERLRCEVH